MQMRVAASPGAPAGAVAGPRDGGMWGHIGISAALRVNTEQIGGFIRASRGAPAA